MSNMYELSTPVSFAGSARVSRLSKNSWAATTCSFGVGVDSRGNATATEVSVGSRPEMRVETREPSGSDVRASIDDALAAGEIRRTDTDVRVGPPARLDADGRRSAAAWAARALRSTGGSISWRAEDEEQVRAIVEGTAYGAYDPGLFKRDYTGRAELTLA